MTSCPRCHAEIAGDGDFCEACGHYLRWMPTGEVRVAQPPRPAVDPMRMQRIRPRGSGVVEPPRRSGGVRLTLRAAADDAGRGSVEPRVIPGAETTLVARIHNRTDHVDHYRIAVSGLPDGWWAAAPGTVELNPYGSRGRHEDDVTITLQPPREPGSAAGPWPVTVSVLSQSQGREVASAETTLHVEAYEALAAELRPARRTGYGRGRFKVALTNDGNAPAEVTLAARDEEDACRFQLDRERVTVPRGARTATPLVLRPPGRHWIGRPIEHPFDVSATGAGDPVALRGTFRRRPWLPWWLAVLVPVAAAALALALVMRPDHALVPDLRGAEGPFAAQQQLTAAGLKLATTPQQEVAEDREPGVIIAQDPQPGAEVEAGAEVTVVLAAGSDERTVPRIIGMPPTEADRKLRGMGLSLGSVEPQPADLERDIEGQLPEAGVTVKVGTAVNVTLAIATPPGPAGAVAGGDGGEPTPTPSPGPDSGAGTLLLDDGTQLQRWDGKAFEPLPIPGGSGIEPDQAPDGRVAYMRLRGDGRGEIVVFDPQAGPASARVVTDGHGDYHRPAFSPAGDMLAYIDEREGQGRLCLQPAGRRRPARCLEAPDWSFARRPAWSPDGRMILVIASRADGESGLFGFRARGVPRPRPSAWRPVERELLVPLPQANAVAWSPDGTTIAVTADADDLGPQLFLIPAGEAGPEGQPEATSVPACEVAWRPDGMLSVSQYACARRNAAPGPIVVLDPESPGEGQILPNVQGANPAWRPEEDG